MLSPRRYKDDTHLGYLYFKYNNFSIAPQSDEWSVQRDRPIAFLKLWMGNHEKGKRRGGRHPGDDEFGQHCAGPSGRTRRATGLVVGTFNSMLEIIFFYFSTNFKNAIPSKEYAKLNNTEGSGYKRTEQPKNWAAPFLI
jgi:hypothetical protein